MGLCDAKRLKKENQDLNNRFNDYKIKERRKNEKINELEAEIKSLNDHCDSLQTKISELTQQNIILSNNINKMNFFEKQLCVAQCQQMQINKKNSLPKKIFYLKLIKMKLILRLFQIMIN